MIEYYPPASPGEWAAAICALVTVFIGLIMFIFPGLVLRATNLNNESTRALTRMAVRSHPAGLLIGFGLSAFLLQQPLLYLVLGISWGFSAFGQMLAMLINKNFSFVYIASLLAKTALALLTVLAVLGFFG